MQMPGSSCPAGVTHFLLLCHILVRPVWQRLSSLPPWLLLLLSPTAEGWDVHSLSPWQDEAGFSGNCVKATKPPYIYIKKTPTKQKTQHNFHFFLFFFEHEGDWRPDGLLHSSPCWGGCFPRDRTGPGRRAVKVCWAAEGKKMQLGRSNFTLCCQSERCCWSRAASRQPLTEDGWYERPRQPPALGFAQRFLFLGTAPGQPHHCALKNVLAGVKSNSFVLTGSGRDASKCWQTPTWCISHRGSGQGKVMLGANPSGCSHSPIQAGAALSPGCHAGSHFLRDFPPGLCCRCKARIYSLLGSGASPPAPGLLFHHASVPSLGCTCTPRCLQIQGRRQHPFVPSLWLLVALFLPLHQPFAQCIKLWHSIPHHSWASPRGKDVAPRCCQPTNEFGDMKLPAPDRS